MDGAVIAWARCKPYIEAALLKSPGGYLIDDVAAGIEAGDFQFWPGANCAVVTEIYHYPRSKALNFWLLGGDLKELLAMRPYVEAWAKAQGCTRVMGGGMAEKRGWGRVLRAFGYRPRWTIYTKELT